jgi:hypothetical protein
MGSLSNLYISQSYQSLLHFGNDSSASTTLTNIQDGVGNDLGVAFNTNGLLSSKGLLVSGAVDINTNFSSSTQGYINQSSINNLIRITGSYTPYGNEAAITEIGIGWVVNGGALQNGRVIGITGTPNVDVTYTIDQYYTANGVTYTFTGSIERPIEITGDLSVSDDLFVGGHLTIEDGVEITGSIDITGDVTASNAWIQGDLVVSGTINAYEIITTIESASVIFSSGSNILGDTTADTQTLIGSVIMSGSSQLTGSMGITGNLNVGGDLTATGNISSSTISGIGNVTLYSQSVDSRLDFLEGPFSTSVDFRLDELEAWSSSIQTNFATQAELTETRSIIEGEMTVTASFLQSQIDQKVFTSSFNAFTASISSSLLDVSASIAVTDNAQTVRINQLASFTGSYATTGSNYFIGNQIFSGSVEGSVISLSISSQTASMDLSKANFFTITLASGSNTHISASGATDGQTISLRVTQPVGSYGNVSFSPNVRFPQAFPYIATPSGSAVDIISFQTYDSSFVYGVAVNTMR